MALDLGTAAGRRGLRPDGRRADVVITSARPRALDQLGLDPAALGAARAAPGVAVDHRLRDADPGSADRVAFGDDAAAAGGLVVGDDRGPCFCADAVADPVTGLAGAAAVLAALADGRRPPGRRVDGRRRRRTGGRVRSTAAVPGASGADGPASWWSGWTWTASGSTSAAPTGVVTAVGADLVPRRGRDGASGGRPPCSPGSTTTIST